MILLLLLLLLLLAQCVQSTSPSAHTLQYALTASLATHHVHSNGTRCFSDTLRRTLDDYRVAITHLSRTHASKTPRDPLRASL
jgi:hypothetical protein